MARGRIDEEVAKAEGFIAAYRLEDGETGFVTGVNSFRAKAIRSVCIRRGIRAQGKAFRGAGTKAKYIAALWEDFCSSPSTETATRDAIPQPTWTQQQSRNSLMRPMKQTKHDVIRLPNVLFNSFVDRLPTSSTSAETEDAEDPHLWEDVAEAYCSTSSEFDALISKRACFQKLQPSAARPHTPTKLRGMWTTLCVEFRAAYTRVLASVEHTGSDFADIYRGRLDVLYLHEWLLRRPEHFSTVGVELLDRQQENEFEHESSLSTASETQSDAESAAGILESEEMLNVADAQVGSYLVVDNQVEEEQTAAGTGADEQRVIPDVQEIDRHNAIDTRMGEPHEPHETPVLKRKCEASIQYQNAPYETGIKQQKLRESSEYVQSLFRTVEVMRSAGCTTSMVAEMLQEAQRQASKLVQKSKSELP